mgnify:CR=1 FL=1
MNCIEEAEEEVEVTESPPNYSIITPPKLKRTKSIKLTPSKTDKIIDKTLSKVKTENTIPQQILVQPTITNIYGREQRDERVKQKSQKMNTLFVNAI